MIGLFCRILSLLQGSFAKETYNLKEPTSRSHSIPNTISQIFDAVTMYTNHLWCQMLLHIYMCLYICADIRCAYTLVVSDTPTKSLRLPQTSRANPVQCCSTHQQRCQIHRPSPYVTSSTSQCTVSRASCKSLYHMLRCHITTGPIPLKGDEDP